MSGISPNAIDPTGIADKATPAEEYTPSEYHRTLAANINRYFRSAHNHRISYEQTWETLRRFLRGDQVLYRHRNTHEIAHLPATESKRLYSVNNVMRPFARSLLGKLVGTTPTFRVSPATSDYAEVQGGRVADTFLQFFEHKENMSNKYSDMWSEVIKKGTSCAQLYWDPTAGQRIAYGPTTGYMGSADEIGQPDPLQVAALEQEAKLQGEAQALDELAAQEQAMLEGGDPAVYKEYEPETLPEPDTLIEAYEGDLKVKVHDTRNVFTEPGITRHEDLRYVIVRHLMAFTDVRMRFPHMAPFISPESTPYSNQYSPLGYAAAGNGVGDMSQDYVWLLEYHERPSMLYPKGRIVYMIKDMILEESEGYYDLIGRLPFFWFFGDRRDGEFWGESPLEQVWHRQKELNTMETIYREIAELTSRPKMLIAMGNNISVDEIQNVTDQRIMYNPVAPQPNYMALPQVPPHIYNRSQQLISDMSRQMSLTAADLGQLGSDPNGRALAILSAESDQQLGPLIRWAIFEWKELHKAILILAKEFFVPERKFSITGLDTYGETYAFEDLNIRAGFDLIFDVEDGLSKNSMVRFQQSLSLWQAGVFVDPETGQPDIEAFKRAAKLKLPGMGPDIESSQFAAAREALSLLKQGKPWQPSDIDDINIFSTVFFGWLAGEGRLFQRKNPQIYATIKYFWQVFEMSRMQQQQAAMMQQAQIQGGGVMPSGASVPGVGVDSNIAQEAATAVQQADQFAEGVSPDSASMQQL